MTTKQARVAFTTSKETKDHLENIAQMRNTSISKVSDELISLALDIQEDISLDVAANERMEDAKKLLSHKDIWN